MSDWYQNVSAQPDVAIEVGSRRMWARAVALSPEDSGHAMVAYAKRQPKAARELMKFIGYRVDGTDDDYYALGRDFIPFVVFRTE
jgi:hypothetical protein